MSLPQGFNFNTFMICAAFIIGAFPLIKVVAYVHDQPDRDKEIVQELRLIREDLGASNALSDKRISILENKVEKLEEKSNKNIQK